jgi:hypothetical protein
MSGVGSFPGPYPAPFARDWSRWGDVINAKRVEELRTEGWTVIDGFMGAGIGGGGGGGGGGEGEGEGECQGEGEGMAPWRFLTMLSVSLAPTPLLPGLADLGPCYLLVIHQALGRGGGGSSGGGGGGGSAWALALREEIKWLATTGLMRPNRTHFSNPKVGRDST